MTDTFNWIMSTLLDETRTVCPYCGVGCGVIVQTQGIGPLRHITGVRGDPEHPANHGRLCTKGSTLHLTAASSIAKQTRLTTPMLRAQRAQPVQPVDWDVALDTLAARLRDTLRTQGADALGLYISGQLLTEDYYVFNKLAKGLLGTNNIDSNSRLCMSSAVAGYKRSLGSDAPPCSYDDLAHAQTVFIAGSNMADAHPILMRRLEDAKQANPSQRWIVVDPRKTETALAADLHLAISPGTDVALFNGMAHLLLWDGLIDAAFIERHTQGFAALRDAVRNATPALTAQVCGIREDALIQAARWFAGLDGPSDTARHTALSRTPTLSLYCQGLNQSIQGTDKNVGLINLHLLTGQVGRVGAGPFSLTGQPNAMGGREVGGMATLSSAHRDLQNPRDRAELAALWGIPDVPSKPGRTAIEMFEAAADGQIDVLWIVCTNPAQSLPDQTLVKHALERCPFVVVQEAYATTATAAYADLLLPATTWGEKNGTVTNSERRISRVRAAVPPLGLARDDWRIAAAVGTRLETHLRPEQPSLFDFANAEAVWMEHRATTRGRDLDITGLSWPLLDAMGPQCWPMSEGATTGTARLYTDARFATEDGRARLLVVSPKPTFDKRDAHHSFSLTTGRLRDQWHGGSRTGTLGRLFGQVTGPSVHMHPMDVRRLGLQADDLVRLKSKRGTLVLPVLATDTVQPTHAFVAMHWGPEFVGGMGVNALMPSARCASSLQPELKHATVKVTPAGLPWQVQARAWFKADEALGRRAALLAHASDWPFAMAVPFGDEGRLPSAKGDKVGVWFRAASTAAAPPEWLDHLVELLDFGEGQHLHYTDPRHGHRRAVALDTQGRMTRYLLAGEVAAAAWLGDWLRTRHVAQPHAGLLLANQPDPPASTSHRPTPSEQICNCLAVDEARVRETLPSLAGEPPVRLAALQHQLGCGTQCGSCLPALRRLVQSVPAGAPAAPISEAGSAPSPDGAATAMLDCAP
jgi:assimilatory nitrate reductase catalytic subunit